MKVGILTYYGVHNHGAVLQANALRTYLTQLGHQVEFLTFDRNYDFIPKGKAKKYKGGMASIPFYVKYIFEKGISNVKYNYKKTKILNQYRNSALPLGASFDSFDGDLVIIGSDEVFSLEIGYNPCLYGIGVKTKNIISYAGCFGPTTIDDIESKDLIEPIRNGLNNMRAISVRDQNSKSIVERITAKQAALVCDPVIMYGYKKEMDSYIPKDMNYIVVYAYDRSMNETNEIGIIKGYAKKHNKKIFSVAYHHDWCDANIQATPNELLGWIKNADCVITDTFHGSVLSIICNTPMIVKIRGNSNKLRFLLSEYKLEDRIMEDFSQIDSIGQNTVNFDEVNSLIEEKREKSRKFLKNALELG